MANNHNEPMSGWKSFDTVPTNTIVQICVWTDKEEYTVGAAFKQLNGSLDMFLSQELLHELKQLDSPESRVVWKSMSAPPQAPPKGLQQ